jgi:muconolactone D-isomerase
VEYFVQFDLNIPEGVSAPEVDDRFQAEATAAAKLAGEGHLVRVWKLPAPDSQTKILSLYRADSDLELDALLHALPLATWMRISVTSLEAHPNDPGRKDL